MTPGRSIETLYGPLTCPDWPDDLIVRSLDTLGEWCAVETELASCLLQEGETLWDGGAFLGTFSRGIALHNRPGNVVAIEANRQLESCLRENLGQLSCETQVVSGGLGTAGGWLLPVHEDTTNHGATRYVFSEERAGAEQGIRCHTLAGLRHAFGDYDFLKLDLEGSELDVLRGDFPYLQHRHPVLWCECNEDVNSLQLMAAMRWLKYDILYLAFPAFRRQNFKASKDLIYPMAYEAALVAAPKAKFAAVLELISSGTLGEDVICRPIEAGFDLRRALYDTPRWAHRDWVDMSRAELIARLGRTEQQSQLVSFLNPTRDDDAP